KGAKRMNGINRTLLVVAAAGIIGLCGCGSSSGAGGGGNTSSSISGVWTGSQRAAGTSEFEFVQTGTSLTGEARLVLPDGTVYAGPITGSMTGSGTGGTVDATVTWSDTSYGSSGFHGTIQSDGSATGS